FSDKVARRANLQRRLDLGVSESTSELLDGVEDIFRRGFGCEQLSGVKLDVSLQDSDKTANPELLRAMKRLARTRDHDARQQVYRALLVADLLLLVGDDQKTPHKVEELGGCPVHAVFTDFVSLRLWQPLGFSHRPVVGHTLFPQLAPLKIGSLLINPKGDIGGELYRNEVDGLAGASARYRS
ncbi:MAG: SseB family protein, partial [Nannocystaceae bacterium]